MLQFVTNRQMREADKATIARGTSGEELMKRAGSALADKILSLIDGNSDKRVLFVCGTGNNGGDGYVTAEILRAKGVNVAVYAVDGSLSEDCLREKSRYFGKYVSEISGDIIVDCIFGTGLSRPVAGEIAALINKINDCGAFIVSADIPSGINGDNGRVEGVAVKADLTLCFGYIKLGCALGDGIDYCGKTEVADIGITSEEYTAYALDDVDAAKFFTVRKRNSHKGSYGSACIISGTDEYLGAAILSVAAALRSGCGYVYAVVPKKLRYCAAVRYPQAIYAKKINLQATAIAFGMGLGKSRETYDCLVDILKSYGGKLIIDADGLNCLAEYGLEPLKTTRAEVLITPHIGEMARLTDKSIDEILDNPIGVAFEFAKEYGIVVHLKNAVSLTCDGVRCAVTLKGNSALAKAGSGDMLAGLICGNAARGLTPFDAAVCSQYILGSSAEISCENSYEGQVTADETLSNIGISVKRLTKNCKECYTNTVERE